jgi:hypothetical protein
MADAMRVTGHTVGRLHRVLLTSNMDVRQPAGIGRGVRRRLSGGDRMAGVLVSAASRLGVIR